MTEGQIVPFGKYKDQPVDVLMQDRSYCEWLLAQAWVQQKYPKFVQVIVAGGVEPQDTPEHNAMQAQFLDSAWFAKLGQIVKKRLNVGQAISAGAYDDCIVESNAIESEFWGASGDPEFEVDGWDVVCLFTYWGKAKGKIVRRSCWEDPTKFRDFECEFETERRVLIELKPMMSDDYPTVLRQIKGRPSKLHGHRFLIVREVAFQHVTWDQVKKIFEAGYITALLESDIAP